MPTPCDTIQSIQLERLLSLIEGNLHYVVKMEMTREQALDIKQRFQRPLGVLNSRFGLRSNSNKACIKQVT